MLLLSQGTDGWGHASGTPLWVTGSWVAVAEYVEVAVGWVEGGSSGRASVGCGWVRLPVWPNVPAFVQPILGSDSWPTSPLCPGETRSGDIGGVTDTLGVCGGSKCLWARLRASFLETWYSSRPHPPCHAATLGVGVGAAERGQEHESFFRAELCQLFYSYSLLWEKFLFGGSSPLQTHIISSVNTLVSFFKTITTYYYNT